MANPVQTYGPDGVLRDNPNFSTLREYRFFEGTTPADTFELQVSINGSGFSSDESMALWGDGAWIVPNPYFEPSGLGLFPGANTVEVRAVLANGSTTPSSKSTVRLVSSQEGGVVALPPTNISVEQKNGSVVLSSEVSSATGFQGMDFWASLYAGGGPEGYTRINLNRVAESVDTREVTEFGSFNYDALVAVDGNGNPLADPLYFRVSANQENSDQAVIQEDWTNTWVVPETTRTIQATGVLSSVRTVTLYQFEHFRNGGATTNPPTVSVGAFSSLSPEEPLYYVVTAVYWDATQNLEYESAYSEEVVGKPALVTTALASIPTVTRQNITEQFITSVFRSNPQIKVEAGSVLRDTVIDPFASESERLRFVLDFFNRARTPALLLQIDDPKNTGTSIPVANSVYKQALMRALYMQSAANLQGVIDSAFDAYASNFGVIRRSGQFAQGEVFFYTSARPNNTLVFPIGTIVSGGSVQYATTRAVSIPFESSASYFDPTTGRYGVTAPIRAVSSGLAGNLVTGQIKNLASTIRSSVRIAVVNRAPVTGGKDQETNLELTVRVQNRLASVDSGTKQGYLQTAADVAGVIQAEVVAAGDALMQRDLDSRGEHRGGKVDVWVQGSNLSTVTDSFAFAFDIAQNVQFEVVGDPADYRFRALDPELSQDNPLVEMLDGAGYGLRNASTGEEFDLSGYSVPTYETIQLDTGIPQPSVDYSDVVIGSYRRRSSTQFTLPRQPVAGILSVVGEVSGTLPVGSYSLVRPAPPLEEGRSVLAGDYLQVTPYTDTTGNLVPSGIPIQVTGEAHVLVGSYPEYLNRLGANFLSVEVYDSTGSTLYKGPDDPSGTPDYEITLGTSTEALSIQRVDGGSIPSGASVLVSYTHDENFTVTYQTNIIVSLTQEAVDRKKHVTADVLVKEAVGIPLDIEATVVLVRGRDRATVDSAIRTNLGNFFGSLNLGDPVRQSDIIGVIENTEGVSYVVVPLSKMVPSPGALIVLEEISADTAPESALLSTYSTSHVLVFLLTQELEYATLDSGGDGTQYQGVFANDQALGLLPASSDLASLGAAAGRAYIIGSEGRSIPGYSDDVTLEALGYVTADAKILARVERTANRVLASFAVGASPTGYRWAVTYSVGEDTGPKNIDPPASSYVYQGDLTLTLDEDR